MSNKKAQITVFMILAAILVLGAIIYFILFYRSAGLSAEEERAVELPVEVKPVNRLVEMCMQELGREALKLAGEHGGYVYPLRTQEDGRSFSIDPIDPSSSDGVAMTETAESGVIYWWYMKTPNNCRNCRITTENIPSIENVERQINKYVEENINSCLENFESFIKEGVNVVKLDRPISSTTITEEDVVVRLEFPLRIETGNKTTNINYFVAHIPLDFKKIYELAKKIALAEAKTNFLEYQTQTWLSINSGLKTKMLPPMYAVEDSYVPRIWIEELTKIQLRSLLTSYISLIQVKDTKDAVKIEKISGLEKGAYKSFFIDILNSTPEREYKNYTVRFYYLNWPAYLHISPSDNGILKATRTTHFPMMLPGLASFVPIAPQREYNFFYDLSYPVVVELRNKEELFGEGYSLLLALEVNLRDNRAVEQWFRGQGTYGPWDYSWVKFEPPVEELKMIEKGEDLMFVRENYTKTLFCSPKQRISGNISITAKDAFNKKSLEGVSVQYSCGRYSSCMIGMTQFELEQNKTLLKEKFPICVGGGIIKLEKEGYKTEKKIDITTKPNEEESFEFEMMPMVLKNVSIKKFILEREVLYREPLEDHGNNYTRILILNKVGRDVDPAKESIIINIRKIDESLPSDFPSQNIIVDGEMKNQQIKLVPGIYEIQTTYVDNIGYVISPEKRCKNEDEDCYFVPETAVELEQTIGGGLILNNVTGYWEINWDDIFSGDGVLFKIVQLPTPLVVEDLNEMAQIENLSWQFRTELQPEIR
jgi:hypothetical protein